MRIATILVLLGGSLWGQCNGSRVGSTCTTSGQGSGICKQINATCSSPIYSCVAGGTTPYDACAPGMVTSHPRILINNQIPDTWDASYPGAGNGRLQAIAARATTTSAAAISDYTALANTQTICPDRSGVVNTSGTSVTWVSGNQFLACVGENVAALAITIGGVSYTIASRNSATSLTTTTTLPTLTGATYTWQYDWTNSCCNVFVNTGQAQAIVVDTLDYALAYQVNHQIGNDDEANGYASSIYRQWAGNPTSVPIISIVASAGTATVFLSATPVPALTDGETVSVWGATDDSLCGQQTITVIDATHFTYSTSSVGTHTENTLIESAYWQGADYYGMNGARLSAWAYLYDWCYDWLVNTDITYAQRARNELKAGYWSSTLTRASSQFNVEVRESDYHNYTSWFIAGILEAGLALYYDDALGSPILKEGRGYYYTGQQVVPAAIVSPSESYEYNLKKSVDALTGGAFNWEGPGYLRNGQVSNLRAIEAYDTATARYSNLWGTQFSTAKNAGLYEIYAQMPDGCKANLGDTGSSLNYAGRDTYVFGFINDRFPDPHFVWMMDSYVAPGANGSGCSDGPGDWNSGAYGQDGYGYKLIFYPYVNGPGTHNLTDLPLGAQFGPDIFFRSGWTSTDVAGTYSASVRGTYHRHEDAGTFTLYKNAPLILGQPYVTTSAPVYANYNRRTIGANTLTIYDPADCWKDTGPTCGLELDGTTKIVNDGGQLRSSRRLYSQFPNSEFQISRLWSGSIYTDSTAWNSSTYAAIYSVNDPKGTPTFLAGTNYEHVINDLTPMYVNAYSGAGDNPTVKVAATNGVIRHLVHFQPTQGSLSPVVTFDLINATSSGFTKSWMLHTVNAPSVNGVASGVGITSTGSATVTSADNGTGRVYVNHLLPATPTVRVTGGNACGGAQLASCTWSYYVDQFGPSGSGGGHLWDSTMNLAPAAYQPNWQIQEQPSASQTLDYFLNVVTPTTTSVGSAPTTTLISGTGLYGAMVADSGGYYVGVFGTNPAGVSTLSYTATHAGTAQHVVAGLSTGTATIKQGSTTIATATVGADGSVGFTETGGGVMAVTVGAAPALPTSFTGAPHFGGSPIIH